MLMLFVVQKEKVKESGFIFTCVVTKFKFHIYVIFCAFCVKNIFKKGLIQLEAVHYLKIKCFWCIFYKLLQLYSENKQK